jgi:hypothetical protein
MNSENLAIFGNGADTNTNIKDMTKIIKAIKIRIFLWLLQCVPS